MSPLRKVITPKSPKGDFTEFVDFQQLPLPRRQAGLQGLGVEKLKINEL